MLESRKHIVRVDLFWKVVVDSLGDRFRILSTCESMNLLKLLSVLPEFGDYEIFFETWTNLREIDEDVW
jgi:hypothetical protein